MFNKLTPDELDRYSMHIIMPQVGSEGQRKLINSSILVIGAGGLGSPAALYLALAGVGKIGIIGRKWAATLSSTGTPSFFLDASNASHGDLGQVTSNDIIILISLVQVY